MVASYLPRKGLDGAWVPREASETAASSSAFVAPPHDKRGRQGVTSTSYATHEGCDVRSKKSARSARGKQTAHTVGEAATAAADPMFAQHQHTLQLVLDEASAEPSLALGLEEHLDAISTDEALQQLFALQ